MNKLTCVYKSAASDPFIRPAVNGRCRLFSVWGGSKEPMSSLQAPFVVELYDGTGADVTGLPLKATFVDTVNSFDVAYGSHLCMDLPSNGILFEEGIVFKSHANCKGMAFFVNGGEEKA